MPCLNYTDVKQGVFKRILVEKNNISGKLEVTGARLVGETKATEWLKEIMKRGTFEDDAQYKEFSRWALAPIPSAPKNQPIRGKVICNCFDISYNDIIENIELGADLITLQNKLKCGTECGSCVPELKKLVFSHSKF